MGLIAHTDTKRVTEEQVMAVPDVPYTHTWHPIPHRHVINALDDAIHSSGMEVVRRDYSLNTLGTRMFGTWGIQGVSSLDNSRVGLEMGIRNSMDKSLSLGICAGTRVLVCDNLAFSGDFIAFRKHTGRLNMGELVEISFKAVAQLQVKLRNLLEWQTKLEEYNINTGEKKILIFDLMDQGVFPPSKFQEYLDAFIDEYTTSLIGNQKVVYTLATVHGACTRMMRSWNLMKVARSTERLEGVINQFIKSYR